MIFGAGLDFGATLVLNIIVVAAVTSMLTSQGVPEAALEGKIRELFTTQPLYGALFAAGSSCSFIGGLAAARLARRRGWLIGAASGLGAAVLSSLLSASFDPFPSAITVAVASLGGWFADHSARSSS